MAEKRLSTILTDNLAYLEKAFSYPENQDITVRRVYVKALQMEAVLLFLGVMSNGDSIEQKVIRPLMEVKDFPHLENETIPDLLYTLIPIKEGKKVSSFDDAIKQILSGNTLILLDGCDEALYLSTTSFKSRGVDKPENENVLKGPKEGFTDNLETNRSLIRKRLRDERLVSESITLGKRSNDEFSLMYIKDLANPELVQQVKERLTKIEVDSVQSLAALEQYIEDRPYSLVPTVLYTERPDRVTAFLREGHVIIISQSPGALIVPVTFWAFFHTPEDQYQRWAYGNFIRLIRLFALIIAVATPSLYIAVTNFHVEMLPTDLLLPIAATRETVPLPTIIEVLIMEISFELLREAGVRVPAPIGPTIGIVGALILGQAAVDANIVSPIMVIVVAITGLASFAIPEMSFSFMIRITRFLFLFSAAFMGFFGLAACATATLAYLVTVESFGVPFMSPLAPHYASSGDIFARPSVWKQWLRPLFLRPLDKVRGKKQ